MTREKVAGAAMHSPREPHQAPPAYVRACAMLNSAVCMHKFIGQKVSSVGPIDAKWKQPDAG